jgi:hypothetical protein
MYVWCTVLARMKGEAATMDEDEMNYKEAADLAGCK